MGISTYIRIYYLVYYIYMYYYIWNTISYYLLKILMYVYPNTIFIKRRQNVDSAQYV